MHRQAIDVEHFVQLRFRTQLDKEDLQTRTAVNAVNGDHSSRRVAYSGLHAVRLANVYVDGERAVLEMTLVALERDSLDMGPTEFDEFWDKAKTALKDQVAIDLRRRKSMVLHLARAEAHGGSSIALAVEQVFGPHAINIMSRLDGRVEEIKMSRKLRGESGAEHPGSIIVRDSPGANVNTGHVGGSQVSNVTVSDTANILQQMREALKRDASLGQSERQDALAEVQVIEAQLQKTKPNGRTVKESLDALAKIASIGGLALKLGEVLGPMLLG